MSGNPRKYLLLISTLLFALALQAQYYPEKIGKKAMTFYRQGLEKANDGNFKEGIQLLENAVKLDPKFMDAYLSIAGMYGELKNYQASIDNYLKAKSIDPEYFQDY